MRFDRLLPEWESEAQAVIPSTDSVLWAHLAARVRPGHFDRLLAAGAVVEEGTALAVRADRLTSVPEREAVARTLRQCIADAYSESPFRPSRVELNASGVIAAEDIIDTITLRLHSPRPVTAVGMARLRVLLADGSGPLYRYGRGDLTARLAAAFSAL
jgi:hypothetical protein